MVSIRVNFYSPFHHYMLYIYVLNYSFSCYTVESVFVIIHILICNSNCKYARDDDMLMISNSVSRILYVGRKKVDNFKIVGCKCTILL